MCVSIFPSSRETSEALSFQKSKRLVEERSLSMGVGCDQLFEVGSVMVDVTATSV